MNYFYTISYFMEEQKINRMLSTRSPRPSSQTYYHFSYTWMVISAKCRGGCVIFYFFKFLRLRACVSFHKKSAMDKYFYLRLGDAEAWKGGRSPIISRLSSFPFDIVWSISNPNLEFRGWTVTRRTIGADRLSFVSIFKRLIALFISNHRAITAAIEELRR